MGNQLNPLAVAVGVSVPAVAVPVLSPATQKLTTDTVKGDIQNGNKWVKLADAYRGDKVTASMLETVKNGGFEEIRSKIKACITLAFTEDQRALLAADTKTLSDSDKGLKKTLQQNIGAYLDKIKTHIANAEKTESEDGSPSAPKTPVQRIQKILDDAITKLQKLESPAFNVPDAVKKIQAVKAMMPAL